MPNPLRRKRNSSAAEHQPALTPFDVQITESGICTIGGLPVVPGDNEALHDSVLNHLHRLAMATGHPVRATVHDGRSGYITPIEVLTDGSSQLVGEPELVPRSDASAAPAASGSAPARPVVQEPIGPAGQGDWLTKGGTPDAPEAQGEPGTEVSPGFPADLPPPLPHTRITSPAEEPPPALPREQGEERRPWPGPESSEGEAAPGAGETVPGDVPPVVADAVTRINQALQRGHIEFAAMTGQHSLASAVQQFGPDHHHVLELQELCAHIAYVAGDVDRSMATALDVARTRQRLGDPRAYESLMRAAAVWPAVREPRQALELGRDLVAVWSALARQGGRAAAEIGRLDAAKRRMVRLAQRASEMGASDDTSGATGNGAG
ncbi:hypothetical protein ACH4TX_12370 [Streptomyces sp. NPDC021098]|uniref:hypothetical protein n=1 Tax=unclassified Streptomyces TaxID=2593676 RepID=UPI0037A13D0D